ncbi:MAG: thioredoxin fold domain-containing protein [Gammaproteobacteria bacterium]|nr:thioredoxin fold domain-containing protein [Gammaproteobacteria bacterium]
MLILSGAVLALNAVEENEDKDEDGYAHSESSLVKTVDLQADAELAESENLPILLLVSQEDCPFCVLIKQEILQPMIISGDYNDKLLIRELYIDAGEQVIDHRGEQRDSAEVAHDYGVSLTPTMLFLGPDGKELAKRMVGIQTVEMFSYYVDSAIDEAIEKLAQQTH